MFFKGTPPHFVHKIILAKYEKNFKKFWGCYRAINFCTQRQWGSMGHYLDNTKKLRKFFPIVPQISDHSVINASKINAKENCKKAIALSKKLHF